MVSLHHVAGDRQTQAQPAFRGSAFPLLEAIEQPRKKGRIDSFAGVAHHNSGLGVTDFEAQGNPAARRREFHCVGEQIRDELFDAVFVAFDHARSSGKIDVQDHTFLHGCGPDDIRDLSRHVYEIDGRLLDGELLKHDARHIQQFVDEVLL